MKTRNIARWIAAGLFAVTVAPRLAVADDEYNFEYFASYKKGCESVVFNDRRDQCSRIQESLNRACKEDWAREGLSCDLDKQKSVIEEYKKRQEQLRSGSLNDSDKSRMEQTIRDLKDDLDKRKALAAKSVPYAESCQKLRSQIQEHFDKTSDLTQSAGDTAGKARQVLLDKLADRQKKREEAKKKSDEKSGDSSLKSAAEQAEKDVRETEKELESFNQRWGKEIPRQVERLRSHYKSEKEAHAQAVSDDTNRYNKCKQLTDLSY